MDKVKLVRPVKRVTIYLPNNSISLFISFRFQLQSEQPEELLIIYWVPIDWSQTTTTEIEERWLREFITPTQVLKTMDGGERDLMKVFCDRWKI